MKFHVDNQNNTQYVRISHNAPVSSTIPECGSSTGGATITHSFLVRLQYGAVRWYFPHLFLSLINEKLKYLASLFLTSYYSTDGVPLTIQILGTDYNDYMIYHACNPFPRDNPILHEQKNYIISRTAIWSDGLDSFETALKIFQSNGIDTSHLVIMDQEDCTEPR